MERLPEPLRDLAVPVAAESPETNSLMQEDLSAAAGDHITEPADTGKGEILLLSAYLWRDNSSRPLSFTDKVSSTPINVPAGTAIGLQA
jgi:hypothetical protein